MSTSPPNTRLISKTNLRALVVLSVTTLCGCFQATNPFYSESEVITDKRLEGSFEPEASLREQLGEESLVLELGADKHYLATYRHQDRWIKLDKVLFKRG